jgi:CBS domain containing-hemolysin-like protein
VSPLFGFFGRKSAEPRLADDVSSQEQAEMIAGIEHLGETTVKEVMVPRTDTVFVDSEMAQEELFEVLATSGHSRIPVYRENIDNVVGIVYAKDVLAALIQKKEISLQTLMRKPFFVPETKRIDSLLKEFKRRKVHIAIVVDEYGGTSGIVCMEDIIEEIVGEIQDEFDDEAEDLIKTGENSWVCDARLRLDEIEEELAINLPASEYDSLAGYVFDLFGRIPSEGESVVTEHAQFSVEKMEGHRILTVRIDKVIPQGSAFNVHEGEE